MGFVLMEFFYVVLILYVLVDGVDINYIWLFWGICGFINVVLLLINVVLGFYV